MSTKLIIILEKTTYICFPIAGGRHPGHGEVVPNHLDTGEKKEGNEIPLFDAKRNVVSGACTVSLCDLLTDIKTLGL